jgi:hypothetical protein
LLPTHAHVRRRGSCVVPGSAGPSSRLHLLLAVVVGKGCCPGGLTQEHSGYGSELHCGSASASRSLPPRSDELPSEVQGPGVSWRP